MSNTKTRILMTAPALSGALVLALALACNNVPQPKPGCTIGQGDFAAKYTPKAGETPVGACAALKGEKINLRDYTQGDVSAHTNTNYIAIRTNNLGKADPAKRTDPNPEDTVYSFGEYPKHSNEESFCVAPTFTPARLRLDAVGTTPAVDKTYEWSNVQILVTARAAGTQIKADLKYTDAVAGCSVNFDVVAMWPAIACGTNGQPDNRKCATKADPAQGITVGCAGPNCLSPDIKTHCDPDLLLCVLDGTPPVFNDE